MQATAAKTKASPKKTEAKHIEELTKGLGPYYARESHQARVWNRALPFNPLEVNEMYPNFATKWLPAPADNQRAAPEMHSSPQMAALRAEYTNKGWQYYPATKMAHEPGLGLPWIRNWEDDQGRVRMDDHWLMYADKEAEEARYQENVDNFNATRMIKEGGSVVTRQKNRGGDRNTDEYNVDSQSEVVPLGGLLSEGGQAEADG